MAATAAQTALVPKKDEGLFGSPGKRTVLLSLMLAVFTLLLYNRVVHFDFVNYDDDHYVFQNAHVRSGLNGNSIAWAFHATDAANWHPITWLSHELDYQLFGMNPAGHHYTSVLLHTLNVILLFLLLEWATGFTWRSLMVAALFAVHPLNVESVAWVAERKNVLCTFFFLLTLGAYGWYVRRPGVKRYIPVMLLFALGLMSKPMIITLPFVLLLLDYWPLQRMNFGCSSTTTPTTVESVRPFFRLVAEKVPLLIFSAASAALTLWAQKAGGAIDAGSVYSLPIRLKNAVACYALYLERAAWPSPLAAMYPHPGNSLLLWKVAVCGLLLLLITLAVLAFRKHRFLAVGWFWYLGIMVPVIGLVQVGRQAMADRYAYIPLLGVFVMVVWGTAELAASRGLAKYLATAGLLAVAALSLVTHVQLGYWHDSISLWSHALSATKDNFVAHDNLGEAMLAQGKLDEAIAQFQIAAQIEPRDPVSQNNLGVLARRQARVKDAIAHYQQVLQLTSEPKLRAQAFTNLGSAYRTMGDYTRARSNYQAALQLAPDASLAWLGLGLMARQTGDLSHAIAYFTRAMQAEPTDVGFLLLAQALADSGQMDRARSAFEQAQRLSKDMKQAQQIASQLLRE